MSFRSLYWQNRDDGVVHADPIGLLNSYYIYPPQTENNPLHQFKLILISDNGDFDEEKTTNHNSLEEAKIKTQQHYEQILLNHIID